MLRLLGEDAPRIRFGTPHIAKGDICFEQPIRRLGQARFKREYGIESRARQRIVRVGLGTGTEGEGETESLGQAPPSILDTNRYQARQRSPLR